MREKAVSGLSVIEIPYGDVGWGVSPTREWEGIRSDVQHWKKYRELDDFKLCGLYGKAGIPYGVEELFFDEATGEEVYLAMARQVAGMVAAELKKGNALLVTGGYCRDAVGICGGIQQAFGKDRKLGVVYLDAHSDMSCPEWTVSGILGGMDLNAVMGLGMEAWRSAAGLDVPVEHKNVILGDFRERVTGCDGTGALVDELEMVYIGPERFSDGKTFRAAVKALADRVDMIYLHIDEDVLDKKDAPNAWCLSELPGPRMDVVKDHIRAVMDTGKVAVFAVLDVYLEPDQSGQEAATLSAMRLIGTGLESWKSMPDMAEK